MSDFPSLQALGIDRLTVPQRIALVQEIWESVSAELPPRDLSDEQKAELRRRSAEHDASPEDIVPWEQIKAEALARLEQ